jgi:hypothetical protein
MTPTLGISPSLLVIKDDFWSVVNCLTKEKESLAQVNSGHELGEADRLIQKAVIPLY